jgi:hypothetical protein
MNYSIHILTTHKNKDRQESLLNTWLKGRSNYTFYTDKSTGIGNQAEVDPDDTYYSNGKKHLGELQRIKTNNLHEQVDWLFFCDDDTCVNLPKLESLLPSLNPYSMYGSCLSGTWPQDTTLNYMSGGAGYLISSEAFKSFGFPDPSLLDISFYSDVCVGIWARLNEIQLVNVNGFHSQDPTFYGIDKQDLKNCYTFHYVKNADLMKKLVEVFHD